MQVEKFLTRLFFLSFGQQPRIGQEPVMAAEKDVAKDVAKDEKLAD